MVRKIYIPEQGEVVWINFNPVRGHEQKGKRPAFVVSRRIYNEKSGLALLCPITSQIKGYPLEVSINTAKIKGAILADQMRSVDWKERKASFISKADSSVIAEVKEKLFALVN
jgi:mRNA interferase MazF